MQKMLMEKLALDGLFLLLAHPVMEITGTRCFSFSLLVGCTRYNMVNFSITDEIILGYHELFVCNVVLIWFINFYI